MARPLRDWRMPSYDMNGRGVSTLDKAGNTGNRATGGINPMPSIEGRDKSRTDEMTQSGNYLPASRNNV